MDRSLPDVDEDDRFLRSSSRVGMGGGSGENDSSSDELASFNFLDFLQVALAVVEVERMTRHLMSAAGKCHCCPVLALAALQRTF